MSPHDLCLALSREWSSINYDVFGGALLQPPTIEVSDQLHRRLGEWNPAARTIRFSQAFVAGRPWWVVREVLKHEMAHQYVSDVLGVEDEETAHGPAFQMVCERYGIDGRAAHKPSEEERRVAEKARKLLALTASSNEYEAQAALAAVQRLLGQHGLAEEDIRDQDGEAFGAAVLGAIVPKYQSHQFGIASILTKYFHVRTILVHTVDPRTAVAGVQLEVVGARHHLMMAEYVHDWLLRVAEQLCPPSLSRKERLDFMAGVIAGHKSHLDQEAASTKAGADGRSLSMVRTDAQDSTLDDYFERRHPKTRSVHSRRAPTASYYEGESAGRGLTMHKPLADAETKLLGK